MDFQSPNSDPHGQCMGKDDSFQFPGMLKEETVSDEVLSTVLAEVVNVLNFKQLSCNSNSPQEEQPITPNYLLHLWSCPSPTPGVFSKDDNSAKVVRWQAQCLASPFWHRWI